MPATDEVQMADPRTALQTVEAPSQRTQIHPRQRRYPTPGRVPVHEPSPRDVFGTHSLRAVLQQSCPLRLRGRTPSLDHRMNLAAGSSSSTSSFTVTRLLLLGVNPSSAAALSMICACRFTIGRYGFCFGSPCLGDFVISPNFATACVAFICWSFVYMIPVHAVL